MISSSDAPASSSKMILLDGNSLTVDDLFSVQDPSVQIGLTKSAWSKVSGSRRVINSLMEGDRVVYGVNTGFGNFARVRIDKDHLAQLQQNLIRSHAVGVGEYISPQYTRMILVLRINVLAKGYSGISPENLKRLVMMANKRCLPLVPSKGTVGASGDLAPLAHLALGATGEGEMWDPSTGTIRPASDVLAEYDVDPLELGAKEGLALINGTQFITALGVVALVNALIAVKTADVIAAITLEALRGTVVALDPAIHMARPHHGQSLSASHMRGMLHSVHMPSEIRQSHKDCREVQDSYTLRCVPQVHGVVHDTLAFVQRILETEMNSATDNPMIFGEQGRVLSGGNFHGEYPAKALDYLAIAVHELSNMSERRIERLVNPGLSRLPAFLVKQGGLNSGLMMAHVTAAALVSENKTLCHPASSDTISTSAAKEDHVSMGGWAARKAIMVVEHTQAVLGIELLAACQALDFLRPLRSTQAIEDIHSMVRQHVPFIESDRYLKPDMDACTRLVAQGRVWDTARTYASNPPGDAPTRRSKL